MSNTRRIGDLLGGFVGVDESSMSGIERALRIRILHDVREPFKRTMPICMPNGVVTEFDVKYEKIPLFCYGCGRLGHGERDCELGPYEEESLLFSQNLKASPWKPIRVDQKEGKKSVRILSEAFEKEAGMREQEEVAKLVEKLQCIILSLKAKRNVETSHKGDTGETGQEGACVQLTQVEGTGTDAGQGVNLHVTEEEEIRGEEEVCEVNRGWGQEIGMTEGSGTREESGRRHGLGKEKRKRVEQMVTNREEVIDTVMVGEKRQRDNEQQGSKDQWGCSGEQGSTEYGGGQKKSRICNSGITVQSKVAAPEST